MAIEQLAEQIRRYNSRFSTSHLIRALAVADRKARDLLVARAVRESCTLSVFERRVQVARGARRAGAGLHASHDRSALWRAGRRGRP